MRRGELKNPKQNRRPSSILCHILNTNNHILNISMHCFQRFCRHGAGVEATLGRCDTPGYVIRNQAKIVIDDRDFLKLEMKRNNARIVQTPITALQGWRGNCDIKVLLYKSPNEAVDPVEIAKVTDYVVSYACKGNEKMKVEKEIMKDMIEG